MKDQPITTQELVVISDFLLETYQQARQMDPISFQKDVLERLRALLPFDFAAWGTGQAEDRQVTEVVVVDQDVQLLTDWPEVGHLDPFCDLTLNKLDLSWRFSDVPNYWSSLAYNEHWRNFSVRHMVSTIMAEPIDGIVSFVGLCSADQNRSFSNAQRLSKQVLMPHLSEALRLNRQSYLERVSVGDEAIAIVDRSGWVLAERGGFFRLLVEEWGQRCHGVSPDILMSRCFGGGWRGQRTQLKIQPFYHLFLVRGMLKTILDQLSPREQQVAELYARGLPYKQVARELGIAPATVRNQLARIYQKLGIGNKAQLTTLLLGTS